MEEVERRVKEEIEKRVSAAMDSEAVQASLQQRLVAERKVLEEQVRVCVALLVSMGCPQHIYLAQHSSVRIVTPFLLEFGTVNAHVSAGCIP